MNKKRLLAASLVVLMCFVSMKLKSTQKKAASYEYDEEVTVVKKKLKSRKPSSLAAPKKVIRENTEEGPLFTVSDREKNSPVKGFEEEVEKEITETASAPNAAIDINQSNGRVGRGTASTTGTSSAPKGNTATASAPKANSLPGLTFHNGNPLNNNPGNNPKKDNTNDKDDDDTNSNVSDNNDDDNGVTETVTCSANVAGGTFNSPIAVELSCNSTSTIKYCISENTCCDPSAGSVYTGPITIGQASKTFCLSFEGKNSNHVTSATSEATYVFDPEAPHLLVTQSKIQVQTTQLTEQLTITSNDFGSPHFLVGVKNFRQNDPSVGGLNLSCQESVEYVPSGWAGGGNLVLLPETPVSPYALTDQLNVILNLPKLMYGDNHLVSYIRGGSYSEDQYACSNSKITLRDFYIFETVPVEKLADSSSNILMGGFSPIGPGEDNTVIYRGPASDTNPTSQEELRSGLVSIFFDK